MISKLEKQRIIERLQFEKQIKEDVLDEVAAAKSKGAWSKLWDALNSGLALLVAGAVVSVFLIPNLQSQEQDREWKRQITADNVKYKLTMMRNCLDGLTQVGASTSQAIELSLLIENPDELTSADYRDFRAQIMQVSKNNIEASSKALVLTIYFPDPSGTSNAFYAYDEAAHRYIDLVERYLEVKYQYSQAPKGSDQKQQLRHRLDNLQGFLKDYQEASDDYDACTNKVTVQLAAEETRYENFDFMHSH